MKWTSLNDLREKYLSFFESKGHLRLPSFSLVPVNDPSLLLINSGMAPMKKYSLKKNLFQLLISLYLMIVMFFPVVQLLQLLFRLW